MLKVGITGGIGSGKSAACYYFETFGIPIYRADERAKYLMQNDPHLIVQLKKTFGEDIYEGAQLNRQILASLVFRDANKLAQLNSLVHPVVLQDTECWVDAKKSSGAPYLLKEAALLVESGAYKHLDKLIVVTAPTELRVERVVARDNMTKEAVLERIKHQMPDEEKIKLADFILVNDAGLDELKMKVADLHRQLTKLAAQKN